MYLSQLSISRAAYRGLCNLVDAFGATILVHPRSLANPRVATAVKRAIAGLRYRAITINRGTRSMGNSLNQSISNVKWAWRVFSHLLERFLRMEWRTGYSLRVRKEIEHATLPDLDATDKPGTKGIKEAPGRIDVGIKA